MTRFEKETGWRRPGPRAICQDYDALMRVKTFDYVLTPGFVAYYQRRTGDTNEYVLFAETPEVVDPIWKIRRAKLQDCWELWCDQPLE